MHTWRLPILMFFAAFFLEGCAELVFRLLALPDVAGAAGAFRLGFVQSALAGALYLVAGHYSSPKALRPVWRVRIVNAVSVFIVTLCFAVNLHPLFAQASSQLGGFWSERAEGFTLACVMGSITAWLAFVDERTSKLSREGSAKSQWRQLIAGAIFAAFCMTSVPTLFRFNNLNTLDKAESLRELLLLLERQSVYSLKLDRLASEARPNSSASLIESAQQAAGGAQSLKGQIDRYASLHQHGASQQDVMLSERLAVLRDASYSDLVRDYVNAPPKEKKAAQLRLQRALEDYQVKIDRSLTDIENANRIIVAGRSQDKILMVLSYPALLFFLAIGLMWPNLRLMRAQQIRLSEQAQLVAKAQNPIFRSDRNGLVVWVNDAAARLLRMRPEDIVGRFDMDVFVSEESGVEVFTAAAEARSAFKPFRFTYLCVPKNGGRYWLDADTQPFFDSNGDFDGSVTVCTDVTEVTEARLREKVALIDSRRQETLLNAVGEAANIGGWEMDVVSASAYWTPQMRCINEVDDDFDPTLENVMMFYAPEEREKIMAICYKSLGDGSAWDFVAPLITAKGKRLWVRSVGKSVLENGVCTKLYGAIQDVTDRVEREDELKRAHEMAEALNSELEDEREALEQKVLDRTSALELAMRRAEEANRAKSTFLASMSHELRTPLNAIIGYSEIMAETAYEDGRDIDVKDHARVLDASKHLLGLITSVLDISKIEADKMSIEAGEFDPAEVIAQSLDAVRPQALSRNITLTSSLGDDLGMCVNDSFKLRQCLINLLSNAVKFTQEGGVELRAYRNLDKLVVQVRDSGLGIAPDKLKAIFEPFTQEDSSITRRFGGTGLGLAITQNLARLMGGGVSVDSRLGEGSCFTLTIALVRHPEIATQAAAA